MIKTRKLSTNRQNRNHFPHCPTSLAPPLRHICPSISEKLLSDEIWKNVKNQNQKNYLVFDKWKFRVTFEISWEKIPVMFTNLGSFTNVSRQCWWVFNPPMYRRNKTIMHWNLPPRLWRHLRTTTQEKWIKGLKLETRRLSDALDWGINSVWKNGQTIKIWKLTVASKWRDLKRSFDWSNIYITLICFDKAISN